MAANPAITGGMVGVRVDDVSATLEADLGSRVFGPNGIVYQYVTPVTAVNIYDALCIDGAGNASSITKTLVDLGYQIGSVPVMNTGVSSPIPASTTAAPVYFWAVVSGVTNVNCIAGSTASVSKVYTTGSTGALGTASGSQSQIRGIIFTASSGGAGFATASKQAILNVPQSYLF